MDCPEFVIELEYNETFVIWHTKSVTGFNRAVYRKMGKFLDQLEGFLSLHYDCLWTAIPPDRKDLKRLARHGGFDYFGHHKGMDVYRKEWKGE